MSNVTAIRKGGELAASDIQLIIKRLDELKQDLRQTQDVLARVPVIDRMNQAHGEELERIRAELNEAIARLNQMSVELAKHDARMQAINEIKQMLAQVAREQSESKPINRIAERVIIAILTAGAVAAFFTLK